MNTVLPIVIALITDERGRVFLTRRNQPERRNIHNKLEFPGGKINFGEDPSDAAVREAKEETGFDIKVLRLLPAIYSNVHRNVKYNDGAIGSVQVLLIAYECKIAGGQFVPEKDKVLDGRFYSRNEIDYSQTLPKTREIIELLDK